MGNRLDTIHANHFDDYIEFNNEVVDVDLSKIVINTVDELLKDSSSLIVEVENGVKNRKELESKIEEVLNMKTLSADTRNELITSVINYLFYYGNLQSLIEDDDISDIDFPKYNYGIIKRNGIKELIPKRYLFQSERDFKRFAQTIIVRNNGILNENYSQERVSDDKYKLRINVSIPPRSQKHTSMNIRKHRQNPYDLEALVKLNMITTEQHDFLKSMVDQKKRYIIAGKGGAGKTTLLRAMMMEINPLDVYLIAEKDSELYFDQPNFIQQRIKKKNQGGIDVNLGDLVKDGLTMSLDGYGVGELTSDETWYFINAGLTDHVITGTIHANGIFNTVTRILSLIETYNPGIKQDTILRMISQSLDYIIYLNDFKLIEIGKILGYNEQTKFVEIEPVKFGVTYE